VLAVMADFVYNLAESRNRVKLGRNPDGDNVKNLSKRHIGQTKVTGCKGLYQLHQDSSKENGMRDGRTTLEGARRSHL